MGKLKKRMNKTTQAGVITMQSTRYFSVIFLLDVFVIRE